ncbi:glutamate--tRNA ligase [Candidatus Wolfebacteria bacterium]|nr:glutamate--tRNA ligase [Candidatus Wolfebacteria bacterium]
MMESSIKTPVRVRFAPSPTGFFHIGSARTALFNWLFARQNNGKMILRIEDTDKERSNPAFEKDIIDGIKWLGMDWDEGPIADAQNQISNLKSQKYIGEFGPYRQSERLDIYEKYLKQLLDENKAYYCFCPKEQLESDRQAMLAQGLAPKYSGRCRNLQKEEVQKKLDNNEPFVIRFKMPETEVEFQDLIRDKVKFNSALIGDMVIAKNSRSPLFVFSNTVDDYEMKISHVIRGEDHLSNTPKQILIQKALGFNEIKYAHLPLILAPDRSKMSKRYMETSLIDYKNQGYLPEAIVNFTAFLGWHPALEQNLEKDKSFQEKEIFSLKELIEKFNLKRVQKAGAVFNIEKLEWFNIQYIKKLSSKNLFEKIKYFVPTKWTEGENEKILTVAINAEKDRIKKLTDFKELANFFFDLPDYDVKLLVWPQPIVLPSEEIVKEPEINKEKSLANLKLLVEEINKIFKADFNKEKLEKLLMPLTEVWGRGDLLWPLRVALSGKKASPGPFEIMEVLGKEETLRRLNIAIEKLE